MLLCFRGTCLSTHLRRRRQAAGDFGQTGEPGTADGRLDRVSRREEDALAFAPLGAVRAARRLALHAPRSPFRLFALAGAAPLLVGVLVASAASGQQRSARTAASTAPTSLNSLSSDLQAEEKATFKVTYLAHLAKGASTTVTFEQQPPNSLFGIEGGELLRLGSKDYFCSKLGGYPICLRSPSSQFAPLIGLFNPSTIVTELKAIQQQVTKVVGATVTSSTRAVAGRPASCETVHAATVMSTWCVTGGGFLAYATATGGSYVQLQSYSRNVPANDFKVPAGAMLASLP